MKKIIVFIIFIFISIDSSFACKIQNLGKEIPKNFKTNCYEQIGTLNPKITGFEIGNGNECAGWNTFIVKSSKKIDTFISEGKIIPFRFYRQTGNDINFTTDIKGNLRYLKDNNEKTNILLDTISNNKIEIEFDDLLESNTFEFDFNYLSNNFYPEFAISNDGEIYKLIKKNDIENYSFKYLKIFFESKKHNIRHEKIEISELNFISLHYKYLIKTTGEVTAYSNNICNTNYINLYNDSSEYGVDTNTKTLDLNLINNSELNPNKSEDFDNDGIIDSKDNCKSIYNPLQKDIDGNGKGDLCSDDDRDNVIGNKDNCIYFYNPKQEDININGIGDKCEFDKDNDGIFDTLDNCINKSNPNQEDTDKDGIGDICDNSIYYNPNQIDKNNNGIGDITEEKEKYLQENDDDKDGIINNKDNCINIANSDQLDTDNDGIGDMCDNCKNYQNKKQLDLNENGIGDICEDSDNDGIEGLNDNCINIANSDQLDTDNDGIGDMCEDDDNDNIPFHNDNCPYEYNPNQIDIDKDGIGDKCDESDNRYIESNSTFFIGLLIFIILIFGGGIFLMIRKLK